MRDFSCTAEPSGGSTTVQPGHSFVIQQHAARRMHYDFRLELDGVLLSWSVPKGPSLSPAERRLAVRTEDHPLDYVDFEGVIPAGQYGGGTVVVWDHGTWEPDGDAHAGVAKGRLTFDLHGEKLRGRNGRGATFIAPYSPRAQAGAPVAVPITWEELAHGIDPATFTTATVPRRLGALRDDPWKAIAHLEPSITASAWRAVGGKR